MSRNQIIFLVVGISLWPAAVLILASLSGCQPGTTGLIRPFSDSATTSISNTVPLIANTAAAVVGPGFDRIVQTGGAVILALLAVWQGFTHSTATRNAADIAVIQKEAKI